MESMRNIRESDGLNHDMLGAARKSRELGTMQKTNGPFFKYIAAVLLFGTNGIVASQIALSSYEIV